MKTLRPSRVPRRAAVACVVLAGLLAACGGGGGSPDAAPAAQLHDPIPALGGSTLAQLQYGAVPTRNDQITYQPDVVLVDGGADAIKSLSGDGLTWTIKGDAGHAQDLAVGKIMLVTGRAVGRVLSIQPAGSDLAVIVGPVELTDVIEKADVTYDQPLAVASMLYYNAPEQPGSQDPDPAMVPDAATSDPSSDNPSATDPNGTGSSDSTAPAASSESTDPPSSATTPPDPSPQGSTPSAEPTTEAPADPQAGIVAPMRASEHDGATVHLPEIHLVSRQDPTSGTKGGNVPIPTFGAAPAQSTQQGITVAGLGGSDGLGYTFDYNRHGIVLKGRAALHLQAPRLHFSITIDHGIKAASLSLDGAAGITMSFEAGNNVGEGGAMNDNPTAVDLPFDISVPLGGPTPLAINIKQVFRFQTLFGARLATLKATGNFSIGGTIGLQYNGGSFSLTKPSGFSGDKELNSSISGDSLGVNGMVLSDQIRVIVGIGAFGFAAGPSFSVVLREGVTNHSDLGAIPCTASQFSIQMGVGIGYAMPARVVNVINFLLKAFKIKPISASGGAEHFETLVNDFEPKDGPCKI